MINHKMDMIASIADCYSKETLGAEDAYLLTIRVIEGSLSVIELLHILAKLEDKPNVDKHYDCNHNCDALYKAYYKGFLDGRNMKKEAEKADNKKSLVDEHEFESCFFGEEW